MPKQQKSIVRDFAGRVKSRELRVGVIGLGYVGLPLLLEFAKAGFPTLGFDLDQAKVDQLAAGKSYIRHVPAEVVSEFLGAGNPRTEVSTEFSRCGECDAILICVPTPLTRQREPDLSFIKNTAAMFGPYLRAGQLIVLESTTYPGTSEEILAPGLEEYSGLTAGKDFFVAYSPEREDPNNPRYSTRDIPKVVGGLTPEALEMACALYDAIICQTVPVSSCRVAEAVKLIENIFRCINIALVNELKVVFTEMDIDIWEVINAASTKPFGYMPFYPGPGLGGHCIPIDPFYLTWKAREYGIATRFIELAGEINTRMPDYVIERSILALNECRKTVNGSRILLVGLAYKKNVDDTRESPAFVLWEKLLALGAEVDYFDPYCPIVPPTREHQQFAGTKSKTMDEIKAGGYDAALIVTDHDNVDYAEIARHVPVVVDTRNACHTDNTARA